MGILTPAITKTPYKNQPTRLIDSRVISALAATGYQVQARRINGRVLPLVIHAYSRQEKHA